MLDIEVSLRVIDDLELEIAQLTVQLERVGADHRYPLMVTAPGFGWINAFSVASEIGDINRFSSPAKLCGYTGLCPRVIQSGANERRSPPTTRPSSPTDRAAVLKRQRRSARWAALRVTAATQPVEHAPNPGAPPRKPPEGLLTPRPLS